MIIMKKFLREERGATAIEYAMIASLVFLTIVAAVTGLGANLTNVYATIAAAF